MSTIVFDVLKRSGREANGVLTWVDQSLSAPAISGPFGLGSLPVGEYIAKRSKLLDKPAGSSYCDAADPANCWFQLLEPKFSTTRTELGIHPDGGTAGTEGCIGIKSSNTKPWYDALKAVSNATHVVVKDRTIADIATDLTSLPTIDATLTELGDSESVLVTYSARLIIPQSIQSKHIQELSMLDAVRYGFSTDDVAGWLDSLPSKDQLRTDLENGVRTFRFGRYFSGYDWRFRKIYKGFEVTLRDAEDGVDSDEWREALYLVLIFILCVVALVFFALWVSSASVGNIAVAALIPIMIECMKWCAIVIGGALAGKTATDALSASIASARIVRV